MRYEQVIVVNQKRNYDMFQFGQIIGAPIVVGSIDSISEVLIQEGQASFSGYVCISNVHMVTTAKKNVALRSAMDAAMVNTSDGMPLVWGLRMQGFNQAQRVSGPDLMIKICEKAQSSNLPVYFYGGSPSVVEVMKTKLSKYFPDLILAGIESPPILLDQPEVDPKVVGKIKNSGAKIVFVGLGCPKQELWMHSYSPHIPAVLIGVGAAFDFFSGRVKRAPLWIQKIGLEWFYRLCSEPQRLWKRYLVTNSMFIYYLLREIITGEK